MADDQRTDELEMKVRAALDASASTLHPRDDWDEVVARASASSPTVGSTATPSGPSGRRPWLVAAAVVAVAGIGAAMFAITSETDRVDTTQSDTTAVPTTLAQQADGLSFDVDWDSLPDRGIIVVDADGTSHLLDLNGVELSTSTAPADGIRLAGGDDPGGVVVTASVGESIAARQPTEPAPAAAPPGCGQPEGLNLTPSASVDGTSFSVCGSPKPNEIWRTTTDGTTAVFSGAPPGAVIDGRVAGHWINAVPSPDGQWVLAQWSGECESPEAYLLRSEGTLTPLTNATNSRATESIHLGWSPDNQIIAMFPANGCGAPNDQPGLYRIDPTTGTRTQLLALDAPAEAFAWRKGQPAAPVCDTRFLPRLTPYLPERFDVRPMSTTMVDPEQGTTTCESVYGTTSDPGVHITQIAGASPWPITAATTSDGFQWGPIHEGFAIEHMSEPKWYALAYGMSASEIDHLGRALVAEEAQVGTPAAGATDLLAPDPGREITFEGIGDLRVGQTLAPEHVTTDFPGSECGYWPDGEVLHSSDAPPTAMVDATDTAQPTVIAVYLRNNSTYRTASGIGIGTSVATLERIYGDRLVIDPVDGWEQPTGGLLASYRPVAAVRDGNRAITFTITDTTDPATATVEAVKVSAAAFWGDDEGCA